ncbi:hypothetical protein BJ085DRAFT_33654 [Dimargaris cristalligena]|uniref:Uncharacterized protein n=1 Tax=Dimargaris cristalligena TaxID=215637 RepID=A0A4P9ZUZ6_9FUNG|nr:hypothetical protein BJ085DRAFT_33654 [Dimargaris cristalligena]|eukprot:RKP37385.1 hypothetical protein BJ085DRAFT_33654 [Dimargaris cristalligena]
MKPYFVPVTLLSLALAHSAVGRPQPTGVDPSENEVNTAADQYQSGDISKAIPLSSGTQAEASFENGGTHGNPRYKFATLPQEIREGIYRNMDNGIRLEEFSEESKVAMAKIEAEWEYLDYTGLNSDQKRVPFPALYFLEVQPEKSIIKLFDKIISFLSLDSPPAYGPENDVLNEEQPELISESDLKLILK